MNIVTDIISIITVSGFSTFAESIVKLLRFPQSLSNLSWLESVAWVLLLLITIRPQRIISIIKNIEKSFIQKIHPNAVVEVKHKNELISDKQMQDNAASVITELIVMLLIAFILSFEVQNLTEAFLLSAAIYSNCGWLLLLIGKTNLLLSFSAGQKLFICLLLLARRAQFIIAVRRKIQKKK